MYYILVRRTKGIQLEGQNNYGIKRYKHSDQPGKNSNPYSVAALDSSATYTCSTIMHSDLKLVLTDHFVKKTVKQNYLDNLHLSLLYTLFLLGQREKRFGRVTARFQSAYMLVLLC